MYELFFILGLALFIGSIAAFIFDKTRISQVIPLMLFGFLLGPALHIVDVEPTSIIVSLLPFLATLALIILLFDAGLMINVFALGRAIPKSTLFTIVVFALSVAVTTAIMKFVLDWPLLYGVLLGAVVGGTSAAVVVSMVERARITDETKSLLTVESTITDALCILTAGIVMELIISEEAPEIGTAANLLASTFSVAIVLGVVSSIAWLVIVDRLKLMKYAYMLTLATVLTLYAMTSALGANGAFAVFVFGIIIGNSKEFTGMLGIKNYDANIKLRLFQEEITFFVRTFFFVYIGMLLSPDYFSPFVLATAIALTGVFLIARWIVQRIMLGSFPVKDRSMIMIMLPRGLAAAVLATMPLSSGLYIPNFQQIVFVVILITNVFATAGMFIVDRKSAADAKTPVGA